MNQDLITRLAPPVPGGRPTHQPAGVVATGGAAGPAPRGAQAGCENPAGHRRSCPHPPDRVALCFDGCRVWSCLACWYAAGGASSWIEQVYRSTSPAVMERALARWGASRCAQRLPAAVPAGVRATPSGAPAGPGGRMVVAALP